MSDDPYSRLHYRRLIAWPGRIEREWPLLDKTLSGAPSRRLLDLGCGTGEHARFLVGKGFDVLGIDVSESMLTQALEDPLPSNLRYVRGDLAELAKLVSSEFGGAICLGNTLPHLTTGKALEGFFTGLRRRLLPGAPFVLQLLNYERIFERRLRHLPLNFREHEGAESVFLRLLELHDDGRVLFFPTTLRLEPGADPPVAVATSKRVELQGWRPAEIETALRKAGFTDPRLYGAFDESPFEPLESPDALFVVR